MIVRAHLPGEIGWIEDRTGAVLTRDARAVVAEEGTTILGMVAFDSWTMNAAMAHMAVVAPPVWLGLLRPAFRYVFEQAKKGVLLGAIPSHNARSLRFALGVGFSEAHRVKDGWAAGDDMVLIEMRREDCRWLGRR